MRKYFVLIFVLLGLNANSQNTLVAPLLNASNEDSLIRIFEEKDKIKKEEISRFCQKNLFKIDTVYSNKDSSLIHYITFEGKTIKKELKIYDPSIGFFSDSIISFFNLNNQLIYYEHWEPILSTNTNRNDRGLVYSEITHHEIYLPQYPLRGRYEYDNFNRQTLSVISRNCCVFRIRTIYTSTNNSENYKSHEEDIKWYQFWEN